MTATKATRGLALALAALCASAAVRAHSAANELIVVCTCWNEPGRELACQGGYSLFKDDVPRDARFEVRDYAGRLLASAPADGRGRVRFKRPEGEFYVLFAGPSGYTAEVDWRDIDATRPARR